jgi:hypothetical protein
MLAIVDPPILNRLAAGRAGKLLAEHPRYKIYFSGLVALTNYADSTANTYYYKYLMNPEGGLEKRRERHFVEISKKRSAMILSKDRSEHGFVDSQTSAFIDRALQFIDDKNFFGLETLTKEFLLANP